MYNCIYIRGHILVIRTAQSFNKSFYVEPKTWWQRWDTMKTGKTKLTQRMSDEEESSMQAQTTQLMSVGIQPPSGLDMSTKKKKENWRIYKQQWNNYAVITNLEKQSEQYNIAMFIYSIGPNAVRVYNAFDLTDEQRKNLKSII